jgi:hypothetical protein
MFFGAGNRYDVTIGLKYQKNKDFNGSHRLIDVFQAKHRTKIQVRLI